MTDAPGRVIALTRVGRDAAVVVDALGAAGIRCEPAADVSAMLAAIDDGADALLLTVEAVTPDGAAALGAALEAQPSWSELPVLLLLPEDARLVPALPHPLAALTSHDVTVLHRPVPLVTLVSAVRSALRSRRRQYEVRDLLRAERRAREEAEEAVRIKDQFLANVSHELRTPIASVVLWGRLLDAGRLGDEDRATAARAILAGAEAQSRLVDDLLDVSRMLTGKLRLALEPCALGPLVEDAADVLRPTADAKGVELTVDGVDLVVRADPDRLRQILWNLLGNAVKFTPPGGRVSLRVIPGGDHVCVEVADTGEGIAPELLPHVFERFRQADASPTRRHDGLGLGLTIVRQLVERHGGTVTARSDGLGRGATFVVRLPLAARVSP